MLDQTELALIEGLGFSIKASGTEFIDFVNQYFPTLQLAQFIVEIDKLLSPLIQEELHKEVSFAHEVPPKLSVLYRSENDLDEKNGLCLSRTFIRYPTALVVDHEFFLLPEKHRYQGKGKALLIASLHHYQVSGINKIRLKTGLQDGGLVWAKLFFTATRRQDVDKILNKARDLLSQTQYIAVKRIYDVYYDRELEGQQFPMILWSKLPGMEQILRQSRWNGELDLNNPNILSNFKLL